MKNSFWFTSSLALVFLLGGCTLNKQTTGNYVTNVERKKVKVGMTRLQVEEILGSPSFASAKDPNIVYYYGENCANRVLIGKTVLKAKLVEIRYNKLGQVHSISSVERAR